MNILEWISTLWPIAVVIVGIVIRIEVGLALNKQRLRSIEKDIEQSDHAREKAIDAVHARMSRHESEIKGYLTEIRTDIKTILARQ